MIQQKNDNNSITKQNGNKKYTYSMQNCLENLFLLLVIEG